ncbi:hypothetical protein D3C72_2289110 [compost metagenome]
MGSAISCLTALPARTCAWEMPSRSRHMDWACASFMAITQSWISPSSSAAPSEVSSRADNPEGSVSDSSSIT